MAAVFVALMNGGDLPHAEDVHNPNDDAYLSIEARRRSSLRAAGMGVANTGDPLRKPHP